MTFGPSSRIRWSITGTTTSAVQPCSSSAASVSSGSKRRRRTSVEDSPIPRMRCARPQEWNSGAAISVRSRARSGIFASSPAIGSSDSGWLAVGALRRAGRAAREDHERGPCASAARRRCGRRRRSAPRASGRAGVAVRPRRAKRLRPSQRARQQRGELLVVDDRRGPLALADLGDLRPGEGGVEKQRVGAELRAGDGRLDEAAVVAAQDRDAVALVDAGVAQRVGERVRAPVDLVRRSACRARR